MGSHPAGLLLLLLWLGSLGQGSRAGRGPGSQLPTHQGSGGGSCAAVCMAGRDLRGSKVGQPCPKYWDIQGGLIGNIQGKGLQH